MRSFFQPIVRLKGTISYGSLAHKQDTPIDVTTRTGCKRIRSNPDEPLIYANLIRHVRGENAFVEPNGQPAQ
jgi:hypothetical protein